MKYDNPIFFQGEKIFAAHVNVYPRYGSYVFGWPMQTREAADRAMMSDVIYRIVVKPKPRG